MTLSLLVLCASALVGTVFAQCDGPSVTLLSNDDVTAISNCGTYNGDIIIGEAASGQIAITGISHLKGALTCTNVTQLTGISFHQLVTISSGFTLSGLPVLSDLTFDSIMEVGDILFADLPALQVLDFATGIVTADRVNISNTALRDLSGLELASCNSLDINNNPDLISITLNDITNTTDTISIYANGPGLEVNFQSLASARGITIQDVDAFNAPLLDTVIEDLDISLSSIRSFASPKLNVATSIVIADNPLLSVLSFPVLSQISGMLAITNNSRLGILTGFPQLETIAGSLNLTGRFSSIEFPSLVDVFGLTTVQTTIDNTTICDAFTNIHATNCTTGTEPPGSASVGDQGNTSDGSGSTGGDSSSTGSTNSGGGLSGAAIGGIVAGVVVLLIALGLGLWWWRRRKNQSRGGLEELVDMTPELPLGKHHEKTELPASLDKGKQKATTYEMPNDNYISELEGSSIPEIGSHGR